MNKLFVSLAMFVSVASAADVFPPSFSHPGNLPLDSVPQFICFGFDDNVYEDGLRWVDSVFKGRKNPDGYPTRATFYVSTHPDIDNQPLWDYIDTVYLNGHEIGNHTQTHNAELFNANMNSIVLWNTEISGATEDLKRQSNIPAEAITGFRTPFLGYSSATFQAMQENKIQYDCSIEHFTAQYQKPTGEWGVGLIWPYTLENGKHASSYGSLDAKVPGIWELPVHEFVPATGWSGVTGLDWNLWFKGYTKQKVIELWQSSLKVRMEGDPKRDMLANRCPLFIGMHSDEYTDDNEANAQAADNTTNRRAAITEYLDWAVKYNPAVRIVPMNEVIKWMKNPVPYSQYHYDPVIDPTPIGERIPTSKKSLSILNTSSGLNITVPTAGEISVALCSSNGREIADLGKINLSRGSNAIVLPKDISAGAYIVRVNGVVSGAQQIVIQ